MADRALGCRSRSGTGAFRGNDFAAAATAFAAGLDVATENRGDFKALRDALAGLFPDAPTVAVVAGPL